MATERGTAWRRAGTASLLAVGSGLLYAAALPPLAWWPAGWIALAPLCIAVARLRPGEAALVGTLAGSVAGALASPWLPAMVDDYFLVAGPLAWVASAAAWILCGGVYFGLFGAWLAWALRRGPVQPLVVGAAWWLCELARVHGVVPNPWALLGYSQMEWPLPAQIADVVGPYGVGAVLVATSACLAGAVVPGLRGLRSAAVVGAVVAAQLVYGAVQLRADRETSPALSVALVQGAVPRAERFDDAHLAGNLERHLALTRQAAAGGATLVAWPELALDFYVENDLGLRLRLRRATEELGITLLAGGLGVRMRDGVPRRTNSVYLVQGGRIRDRYDKVRPMAFSEATPFHGLLGFVARPADGSDPILAGDETHLLATSWAHVGVATCSEAMYPDYVGQLAAAGAGILLAPSNDGWFGSRSAALQQLRAVSMRAIENRRYLLRPTASGYTAVVDPQGRVVEQAPYGEPAFVLGRVRVEKGETLYTRLGDATAWLPFALVGVDAAWRWRRAPTLPKKGALA